MTVCGSFGHVNMPRTKRRLGYLLVAEPEMLLRWSLATYLSKWFDVFPVDSCEGAQSILDDHAVDGAVFSDEFPSKTVQNLAEQVQLRNPNATIVHTVTNLQDGLPRNRAIHHIEKPFELADLAALLGVGVRNP